MTEFIGNIVVRRRLTTFLRSPEATRALIFSGPPHVGKFLVASTVAHALSSRADEIIKDDTVWSMVSQYTVASRSNPDILFLSPPTEVVHGVEKTRDIAVESVRDALVSFAQTPLCGAWRVLIVDDAHRMSIGAQNVLLKTIEELPSCGVVIFVTYDNQSLLSTIRSRCVSFSFGLVDESDYIDDNMKKYASIAAGCPGIAMLLATSETERQKYTQYVQILRELPSSLYVDRFARSEQLSKNLSETITMLTYWELLIHFFMYKNHYNSDHVLFIVQAIERINDVRQSLSDGSVNARLVLDDLFLSFDHALIP